MPKVNKDYFEKKAQTIIDAALRVCKSKPAYGVTLKDVVKECGISQGGIYCYFSDIDEIFAGILNRCYSQNKLEPNSWRIFEGGQTPERIICEAFVILGRMLDSMIQQYGTIIYQLNALYLSDSARGEKTQKLIHANSDSDLFLERLIEFIGRHIANGYFKPAMPKEHIILLINISFQGITRTVTFTQNAELLQLKYGIGKEYTSSEGMMKLLAQSILEILKAGNKQEVAI